MKMFVRIGIAAAAFFATAMSEAWSSEASRSDLIQATKQFTADVDQVSQFAQQNGYTDIAPSILDMARLGSEVEVAARTGTVEQAQRAVNGVINFYVRAMRPRFFIAPSAHRDVMCNTMYVAIEHLLIGLHTIFPYSDASGGVCDFFNLVEVTGGSWEEDGGSHG